SRSVYWGGSGTSISQPAPGAPVGPCASCFSPPKRGEASGSGCGQGNMAYAPRCCLRRKNSPMTLQCSLVLVLLLPWPAIALADETARLPDTEPLTWQGDLSEKMMDGLHRYIERKIARSVE